MDHADCKAANSVMNGMYNSTDSAFSLILLSLDGLEHERIELHLYRDLDHVMCTGHYDDVPSPLPPLRSKMHLSSLKISASTNHHIRSGSGYQLNQSHTPSVDTEATLDQFPSGNEITDHLPLHSPMLDLPGGSKSVSFNSKIYGDISSRRTSRNTLNNLSPISLRSSTIQPSPSTSYASLDSMASIPPNTMNPKEHPPQHPLDYNVVNGHRLSALSALSNVSMNAITPSVSADAVYADARNVQNVMNSHNALNALNAHNAMNGMNTVNPSRPQLSQLSQLPLPMKQRLRYHLHQQFQPQYVQNAVHSQSHAQSQHDALHLDHVSAVSHSQSFQQHQTHSLLQSQPMAMGAMGSLHSVTHKSHHHSDHSDHNHYHPRPQLQPNLSPSSTSPAATDRPVSPSTTSLWSKSSVKSSKSSKSNVNTLKSQHSGHSVIQLPPQNKLRLSYTQSSKSFKNSSNQSNSSSTAPELRPSDLKPCPNLINGECRCRELLRQNPSALQVWSGCYRISLKKQDRDIDIAFFDGLYAKLCKYLQYTVDSDRIPSKREITEVLRHFGGFSIDSNDNIVIDRCHFLTFWKWFSACCEMMRDDLFHLWDTKFPFGLNPFLSRSQCQSILESTPQGTV